ncbi:MAG: hypothetical protein JRI68_04795 [Deltaproteobacteria bacterium]|nr:hypothetical protein [Deltaproteobacteria bacterium]
MNLLITDSLGRPLASAPYSLHRGDSCTGATLLETGRLDGNGRLRARWREPGVTLLICYRAIVLVRGADDGLARSRDRLTCLGFDTGAPYRELDARRVDRALRALHAHAVAAGVASIDADPHTVLDAWVAGRIGVAEPVAAAPAPRRRSLLRRLRPVLLESAGSPSGSHLHDTFPAAPRTAPFDDGVTRRKVTLAVTPGPTSARRAGSRIVVYDWFTGHGPPPRAGNAIDALVDGKQMWAAVAADIMAAKDELCISTWWADPDIELTRPTALARGEPEERQAYRLAARIEALAERGGRTLILLWNWVGTPIVNRTLRRWAVETADNVEVLQRAHPRLTGSFHQKTLVMDRTVAYCGGFNLRQNDWDSQLHRIDDPRRNPHAAGNRSRQGPLPAYGPRHDVAVRIVGPLVTDVHRNFARYWNSTLGQHRGDMAKLFGRVLARLSGIGIDLAPLKPDVAAPAPAGTVVAQLVGTDPRRPERDQAIYDVLVRAIHNARKLIYIENQYFRSSRIGEALVCALRQHPDMELIVVTNAITGLWRLGYGGAYHTAKMQQAIQTVRPSFQLHELLSCGQVDGQVRYEPIHVHAKVMIVDNEWITVGSANLNERSIRSEAEANVAIEDGALATELRCRLMAEHLGLSPTDERLADLRRCAALWRWRTRRNAEARTRGQLAEGHAHPFEQKPSLRALRGRAIWF